MWKGHAAVTIKRTQPWYEGNASRKSFEYYSLSIRHFRFIFTTELWNAVIGKKEEEEVACFARNFWALPDALPQTEADGFQFFPSLVGKRKETVNVEQQQRKQITVEWRMRCLSASSMSSSSPFRKSLTASKAHNAFSRSTVIYRRSACIRFSLNFAHESEASFTFSFPYISRWFSFLRSCLCNTTTVVATRPSEAGQLNMRMWLWSAYVRHAATGKKAVRWMRDGYTFFEPS